MCFILITAHRLEKVSSYTLRIQQYPFRIRLDVAYSGSRSLLVGIQGESEKGGEAKR